MTIGEIILRALRMSSFVFIQFKISAKFNLSLFEIALLELFDMSYITNIKA